MPGSLSKYALVPVFLGLTCMGGYTTIATMLRNGFAAAVDNVLDGNQASIVGALSPFKRVYTGIAGLDRQLGMMALFFAAGIDGKVGRNTTQFLIWGMGQAGAAWILVMLESLRAGNRGRVVSFTGAVGIIMQNITYTVTMPLWCLLHLFTSPVANIPRGDGNTARWALITPLWDMSVLGVSVFATGVVPLFLMVFPEYFGHSADTHYGLLAGWQPFPAYASLLQLGLSAGGYFLLGNKTPKDEAGKETTPGKGYLAGASNVYRSTLALCMAIHLPIMANALAPTALREAAVKALPGLADFFREGTFAATFLPRSPLEPPTIIPTAYGSGDLAPLFRHFLQYDIYLGSTALIIWSLYLHQTTVKNPNLLATLAKSALWTAVGGPTAAATVLLWDRDQVVLEGEEPSTKKTN